MIDNIVDRVLETLRGPFADDVKSEIAAATLKHVTTMLYLGAPKELPHDERLAQAVDAAFAIDEAVEQRLEDIADS